MNPVRSLAPCIVNHSFTTYHWIYWVGPIAGVILAVLIYKLVKALEYESVNGEEHNDSLDLLPRIIQSRKPSSVVALASNHSGYESIRSPTPKPASLRPTPQSPPSSSPPKNETMPARPSPTAAPANTGEKKEEKVEQLPECFAD